MNKIETYCYRCHQITETVFLPLSSGHIGNCCADCRATRKGKPFVSKRELLTINANANEGQGCDHEQNR